MSAKTELEALQSKCSKAYYQLQEEAIIRTLTKIEGVVPSINEMAKRGRFIECEPIGRTAKEFQWDGIGLFQIETAMEGYSFVIRVKDLV